MWSLFLIVVVSWVRVNPVPVLHLAWKQKLLPWIFCVLTQSHTPRINTTWLWCTFIPIYCYIQLINILFRIFVSTFMSEIGLQFSFSDNVRARLWCQNYAGLIKWVRASSHFSLSARILWVCVIYSLNICWNHLVQEFHCGKVIHCRFHLFSNSELFIFSVFLYQFY